MSSPRRLRGACHGSGRQPDARGVAPRPRRGPDPRTARRSGRRRSDPRPSAAATGPLLIAGLAGPTAAASPGSAGSAGRIFSDLVPWLAVLGLVVIVGGVVLLRLRRGVREDAGDVRIGFTLHDLREMHARGELTDEEFTRARDALVEGVRRSAEREATERDST